MTTHRDTLVKAFTVHDKKKKIIAEAVIIICNLVTLAGKKLVIYRGLLELRQKAFSGRLSPQNCGSTYSRYSP